MSGSVTADPTALVVVTLLGMSASVLVPTLQTRLMDVAHEGQSLAASLNHSTLNVANALGAWLGSLVLAAGRVRLRVAEPGPCPAGRGGSGAGRRLRPDGPHPPLTPLRLRDAAARRGEGCERGAGDEAAGLVGVIRPA